MIARASIVYYFPGRVQRVITESKTTRRQPVSVMNGFIWEAFSFEMNNFGLITSRMISFARRFFLKADLKIAD